MFAAFRVSGVRLAFVRPSFSAGGHDQVGVLAFRDAPRIVAALLCAAATTVCVSSSGAGADVVAAAASPAPAVTAALRNRIKYVIVIYQENWSFDSLYGSFPGANGLAGAAPSTYAQVDKVTRAPIARLPQPLIGRGTPDPNFAAVAGRPVQPYAANDFIKPSQLTGDIVHRFYQEQSQIDGGKMDGFMTWSDNPGLVLSYFDASSLPEGRLAAQFTLADNFFHSAFGGSFLNHIWLICTCTPTFPGAPASAVAAVDATGKQLALNANGQIVHDGFVTPDGFVVNTAFTVNAPHPAHAAADLLVPQQTDPTIGDRLSAAKVSWKWYSGGWNDALSGNPDPNFQYHHQPFAYFKNYADGTAAKAAHLQDEANFLADLRDHALPAVSFVKPLGEDNEHPGYATLQRGQAHVAALVQAIQRSPYWKNAVVIITYDENGGRWDHVTPPAPPDRWGPGTRVPTLLISPWVKHRFVDHAQYETASILALIETLYGVAPLGTRDAAASPFTNAFDLTQTAR
jgi:phospholipase C